MVRLLDDQHRQAELAGGQCGSHTRPGSDDQQIDLDITCDGPGGDQPEGADAICTYLRRIRVDGAEAKPTGSRRRSRFLPAGGDRKGHNDVR